jgi:hypothetical protein
MTSRSNAAASSSEDLRSAASNTPPPPSLLEKINTAASSSRNALGVTNGWGVGLAHSGSYVSTTTRTSCTIPLLTEDQSTHDAIKGMIRIKKMREIAAMQAARLKKQQQMLETNDDTTADKERVRRESREKALAQITEGREQLDKLESDKASLEEIVLDGWKDKITDFEQQMSVKERKELDALTLEHDGVVGKMLNDVMVENNEDRAKLAEALNEVGNEKKRKLEYESTEEEEKELQSVVKQKELKTVMEEMNDLNKTKGHMVWLLKQVITAELTKKKKSKPE